MDSSMAGLSMNASEATIISTTANAFRLTGKEAAVIITRIEVLTVSSPMRSKRGPTFKNTAVVTAMATKINALAVSESCIRSACSLQSPPCQFKNNTHDVKNGNGRAVREASSQSLLTILKITLAMIHMEKGTYPISRKNRITLNGNCPVVTRVQAP